MKNKKKFILWTALGVAAFVLSGCYTVLQVPYSAADSKQRAKESDRYARTDQTIGRFGQEDQYDYPGVSGYGYGGGYGGYGGGYPGVGFGYNSGNGPYGYGAPFGYGYGAGPLGYGSDPYYSGNGGYYAPPGYELVTTNELDRLRHANNLSNQATVTPISEAETARIKQIERDKKSNAWDLRDPRAGRTPTPTPRAVAAPQSVSSSSSSSSKEKTSGTASKSSSTKTKKSAKPRRTRR